MLSAVERFLRYLKVERNCSDLTIKSYREDLVSLIEYLEQSLGHPPQAAQITPLDLRTYVVYRKSDKAASLNTFECRVVETVHADLGQTVAARPNADDTFLRTFRLAMSVTGE